MAHQKRSAGSVPLKRNRKKFRRKEKITALALDSRDRSRRISKVLWITLALNWSVSAMKVAFGLWTQCMVIVADGLHSFADGSSNIAGLVAIHIAGHPPDEDHPYGHQKFETFAATLIAFFLFVVSLEIIKKAVVGFFKPLPTQVTAASFWVMMITFAVNVFVVLYERRQGKRLNSDFLINDSMHTATDVFLTLSVLVALVGIQRGIPYIDSIFSLGIAGLILWMAFTILKRGLDILVDRAVVDPKTIEMLARSVGGVRDCHEIRTRGTAQNVYVDMHVLVDGNMTVIESHRLANLVENRIRKELSGIRDVIVHIEPVTHDHKEVEGHV